jgi:hypothetical protein
MDFVDEQDIAFAEAGENCREVSGSVECGTRGDMKANLEFGSHDAGQSCFSEPWRTSEQQVIDGLFAPTSGLEDDAEMFLEFTLTNEVVEVPRTQAALFTNDVGT